MNLACVVCFLITSSRIAPVKHDPADLFIDLHPIGAVFQQREALRIAAIIPALTAFAPTAFCS
jgi:hypothetical protein